VGVVMYWVVGLCMCVVLKLNLKFYIGNRGEFAWLI